MSQDPLLLLKRHGKSATLENDSIVFSDGLPSKLEIPRSTATRFRMKNKPNSYYTIDALWFCIKSSDVPLSEYITAARKDGIVSLAVADKKVLEDYISGKLSELQLPKNVVDPLPSDSEAAFGESGDGTLADFDESLLPRFTPEQILKAIISTERSIHTSKSILVVPSKDFRSLFSIGQTSKSSSHNLQPQQHQQQAKPAHQRNQSRPDVDFYKSKGMGTEDVDTRGSLFFSPSALGGATPSTSSSMTQPSSSSSQPSSSSSSINKRPSSTSIESNAPDAKRSKTALKPIIVVPGVASSPINRYNMKKFFEEGTWNEVDPSDPNLDENAPHKIEFMRKKPSGEQVPYEVVDTTAKFTSSDWERVVAIFTIGKTYQFKAYPYGETRIADMFKKHCGIYLRVGSEKIPQDTIAKWNVKVINVSTSHRHSDIETMIEFWNAIDNFVLVSKISHLKT